MHSRSTGLTLSGPVVVFIHGGACVLGLLIVLLTLRSVIRTFVLPRSANDWMSSNVFALMRRSFQLRLRWTHSYAARDAALAFYAPVSLLVLIVVWLAILQLGYVPMYWAFGSASWSAAFVLSGSSLLTLGFAQPQGMAQTVLSFSEATIGLVMVALLIAYLPTMYTAWSRREAAVTLLEVRAGSPPTAVELIQRYYRVGRFDLLHDLWLSWEAWFADVGESHTSLAVLPFFRSPKSSRSWVVAAGTVLDAGALMRSTVDVPHDAQIDLCLRAGYITLREITSFFKIPFNPSPQPGDPITITRAEFDAAYSTLAAARIPLRVDRDQAWRDFAGWRVTYEDVLLKLAILTAAPPDVPWCTDRLPNGWDADKRGVAILWSKRDARASR